MTSHWYPSVGGLVPVRSSTPGRAFVSLQMASLGDGCAPPRTGAAAPPALTGRQDVDRATIPAATMTANVRSGLMVVEVIPFRTLARWSVTLRYMASWSTRRLGRAAGLLLVREISGTYRSPAV